MRSESATAPQRQDTDRSGHDKEESESFSTHSGGGGDPASRDDRRDGDDGEEEEGGARPRQRPGEHDAPPPAVNRRGGRRHGRRSPDGDPCFWKSRGAAAPVTLMSSQVSVMTSPAAPRATADFY